MIGAVAVLAMGGLTLFAFVALGPIGYAVVVGGAVVVVVLVGVMVGAIRRR